MIRLATLLLPLCLAAADLTVEQPWSRATAAGQTTGAIFLTIKNSSDQADVLERAVCDLAATVELHTHAAGEDGVMRMRPVPAIEIPAKGGAVLKPGGMHIMLIGLKQALAENGEAVVTLHFRKAGDIQVKAPIHAAGASGPATEGCPHCR